MGIRGTRKETLDILERIKEFTNSIQLRLSESKTKVRSLNNEKVLFLGTTITRSQHTRYSGVGNVRRLKRNKLGIRFEAPLDRINKKLEESSFMLAGKSSPKYL